MRKFIGMVLLMASVALGLSSQQGPKYYRIDQVKTLKGKILSIKNEKCYRDKNFIVIELEESVSQTKYRIEVAPAWFFNLELAAGQIIEVRGAIIPQSETHTMLADSIILAGEIHQFRDKFGFPLWRGQGKHRKQGRKGRRQYRGGN